MIKINGFGLWISWVSIGCCWKSMIILERDLLMQLSYKFSKENYNYILYAKNLQIQDSHNAIYTCSSPLVHS
jgi:hypothetical protein